MFLGYIDPGSGFTIFSFGGWLIVILFSFFGIFLVFLKRTKKFFKNNKKIVIFSILFIMSLILIIGAAMNEKSDFDKKIIILGFDGLSPKIIEPMMTEGELPNFSKLKDIGSYRRLSTTNPSQSPVAWAGFATGKNPGKNGVFDFIVRDPRTYSLRLSLSSMEKGRPQQVIKSKCFWHYTSDEKIPTTIIGCPLTFPPDKIYGRMLSGMGVPDILGTEGTFTFYTSGSLSNDKDIGGKVFKVNKSPIMIMNLIGPRVSILGGKADNLKVPLKVTLQEDKNSIFIEFQNNKFELKKDKWSDWKEITFKSGLFKKIKGIFKFYLVGIQPEFKLYISPINFDPRKPFFPISYPSSYSKELADNLGLYYTQGMPIDTWSINEKRLNEKVLLEQTNVVMEERKRVLDFELKRFNKGVLFCYFGLTDTTQHMFWRYIDSSHPLYEENASQEYKETIKIWYKKMDSVLGDVMKRLNKEDTLIVLSDHGFDTFRRVVHINAWLRQNGYLELKNPHAESGSDLLEDINWSRTKAYAIGFGGIYINQQDRERDGIVKPGQETEMLKKEIAIKLKEWQDGKYNQPIINNVYKKEDIFLGKYTKDAPDLYVGFNVGYRASWQTALGGVPKDMIEDNLKKWSGDHLFDPILIPGVLFLNRKIEKEQPSIYDITPTILKIIDYDRDKVQKCDFDGKSLL
nr:alkaline phosphatase family protein [Candidatus Omnitrophota bacterium]